MVHPKRLNKIKLEDVIAILTLSLFVADKLLIYGFKIGFEILNFLKFQHCNKSSLWRFQAKEFSFTITLL